MARIWKYTLQPGGNVLHVPDGARALSVGQQMGEACIWFVIPDPLAVKQPRTIELVATGWDFDHHASFRFGGTIVMGKPTNLVWHVFADFTGQFVKEPQAVESTDAPGS